MYNRGMSELFKKLNVLLKSTFIGQEPASRPAARPGKDMDRELERLRGRVNEAIQYEERLKQQLRELESEIQQWDQAADDALRRNDQDAAHAALEKLRTAKRRYARLDNDLSQHEVLSQELIQSVNLLESVVQTAPPAETPVTPDRSMVEVLKQARAKISALGELTTPKAEIEEPVDQPDIEDDLEQRRQRLSRR